MILVDATSSALVNAIAFALAVGLGVGVYLVAAWLWHVVAEALS